MSKTAYSQFLTTISFRAPPNVSSMWTTFLQVNSCELLRIKLLQNLRIESVVKNEHDLTCASNYLLAIKSKTKEHELVLLRSERNHHPTFTGQQ